MKPDASKVLNTPWSVRTCGNPAHGPEWTCHSVIDSTGARLLHSVTREVAERYALVPDVLADNATLLTALLAVTHGDTEAAELRAQATSLCHRQHPGAALLKEVGRLRAALAYAEARLRQLDDSAGLGELARHLAPPR